MENGGPQRGVGQLKVERGLGPLLEVSEPWRHQNCRQTTHPGLLGLWEGEESPRSPRETQCACPGLRAFPSALVQFACVAVKVAA